MSDRESLFSYVAYTAEDRSFLAQRDRLKGESETLDYALGLIERLVPVALEMHAEALDRYVASLPEGVTTEAGSEAWLLRDEARRIRG